MSRRNIYDNWGRLVSEVLKRKQNRQLCYDHSRSPSILSEASDFGSTITDDVSSIVVLNSHDVHTEQAKNKSAKSVSSISGVVSFAMNMMAEKKLTTTVKLTNLKKKFFHQNAETVTKQLKLASNGSNMISMNIFTSKELKKAADNFAHDKIQGRGGYGTVYKGILHHNEQLVAIKKPLVIDKTHLEIFIVEATNLCQVNHQNIVKLLGCCLEIKAPLLVYEYLPNKTLYHQIHNNGGHSWFSWDSRLRIASEVAGALAYLHSPDTKPTIIHANFTSSNILMDEYYTAKISGFGGSMLVPSDQTEDGNHVAPFRGFIGYSDPECFHMEKLTEKSDVYSFGFVLAELMTGMKPISYTETGDRRNLATVFVTSLEKKQLFQILDSRVAMESSIEQIHCVAELVRKCLSFHGDERPHMKEVALELEGIRSLKFPAAART